MQVAETAKPNVLLTAGRLSKSTEPNLTRGEPKGFHCGCGERFDSPYVSEVYDV